MLHTVEEILQKLADLASLIRQQPLAIEVVELAQAQGRILAVDVVASVDVPPTANSAMDGIAFCFSDLPLDSAEVTLPISAYITAGQAPQALEPGTVARIFTGAPIPLGADTVVMQEACTLTAEQVTFKPPLQQGEHVRPQGQDIRNGQTVLTTGTRLGPAQLGVLAAIGEATVSVYRPLKVGILCTGDELVMPGQPLQPGQIYNSNLTTISSVLQGWGCETVALPIAVDQLAELAKQLRELPELDLLLTTGGVSVGEADLVRAALTELGEIAAWKVAIKPGKPMMIGKLGKMPVLGLPGNPQSVWITLLILARPFIHQLQGRQPTPLHWLALPASFARPRAQTRREYLRVQLQVDASGQLSLVAHPNQSSGVLTSAAWADGVAIHETGTTFAAGDRIPYLDFAQLLA